MDQMEQSRSNGHNRTELEKRGPNGPNMTEVDRMDRIEPMRTKYGFWIFIILLHF